MIIRNKDVIQSYLLTTARYDFSIYEKRILFRLVEMAQDDLKGKKLNAGYMINKTLFKDLQEIMMPVSALFNSAEEKNHYYVKNAFRRLRNKIFEYEKNGTWELIGIIEMPKFKLTPGFVTFYVNPIIWDVILNFAKGFRKFELKTAMEFKNRYAMRFYELFSGQKTPIVYSIQDLKLMFKIENQYKQINDFFKRVIIPAKKELDKKSPYSFEFEIIKKGRKITAIKFFPYLIPKNRDEALETKKLKKAVEPHWYLDKMTLDYLKQSFLFTSKEINNNIELFKEANGKLDLMLLLSDLKAKNGVIKNIKGYVIGAIKKKLKAPV